MGLEWTKNSTVERNIRGLTHTHTQPIWLAANTLNESSDELLTAAGYLKLLRCLLLSMCWYTHTYSQTHTSVRYSIPSTMAVCVCEGGCYWQWVNIEYIIFEHTGPWLFILGWALNVWVWVWVRVRVGIHTATYVLWSFNNARCVFVGCVCFSIFMCSTMRHLSGSRFKGPIRATDSMHWWG